MQGGEAEALMEGGASLADLYPLPPHAPRPATITVGNILSH